MLANVLCFTSMLASAWISLNVWHTHTHTHKNNTHFTNQIILSASFIFSLYPHFIVLKISFFCFLFVCLNMYLCLPFNVSITIYIPYFYSSLSILLYLITLPTAYHVSLCISNFLILSCLIWISFQSVLFCISEFLNTILNIFTNLLPHHSSSIMSTCTQ